MGVKNGDQPLNSGYKLMSQTNEHYEKSFIKVDMFLYLYWMILSYTLTIDLIRQKRFQASMAFWHPQYTQQDYTFFGAGTT